MAESHAGRLRLLRSSSDVSPSLMSQRSVAVVSLSRPRETRNLVCARRRFVADGRGREKEGDGQRRRTGQMDSAEKGLTDHERSYLRLRTRSTYMIRVARRRRKARKPTEISSRANPETHARVRSCNSCVPRHAATTAIRTD